MLELLQLTEALLVATALTVGVVATPVALINGSEPPDLTPLVEHMETEDTLTVSYTHLRAHET